MNEFYSQPGYDDLGKRMFEEAARRRKPGVSTET